MTTVNPNLARVQPPPIMEVQRWVRETTFPTDRPLLNFSQAAPADPPPLALRERLARAMLDEPGAHFYGPVLGNADLRDEIAARWGDAYGTDLARDNVAITAGCNEAFCVAVQTLAAPGEAVMLPSPWYFNHRMWLDMTGIECLPLPCDDAMLPDLDAARAAMHGGVRAIVLVTPNNPTGAEYPDALMQGFHDLARAHGAALIVDETYRDFHSEGSAPHGLFRRDDWAETLIHLYSFSKVFRLTGHRTGAMVAGAERIAAAEKVLDTVTICPAQSGQIAAVEGLRNLGQWVAGERDEILARRAHITARFAADLPDWRLRSAGAYFAWVEPPGDAPARDTARRLIAEQSLLVLPGSMFLPDDEPTGALRIAFANADRAGLDTLVERLAAFRP